MALSKMLASRGQREKRKRFCDRGMTWVRRCPLLFRTIFENNQNYEKCELKKQNDAKKNGFGK